MRQAGPQLLVPAGCLQSRPERKSHLCVTDLVMARHVGASEAPSGRSALRIACCVLAASGVVASAIGALLVSSVPTAGLDITSDSPAPLGVLLGLTAAVVSVAGFAAAFRSHYLAAVAALCLAFVIEASAVVQNGAQPLPVNVVTVGVLAILICATALAGVADLAPKPVRHGEALQARRHS